MSITDTQSNGTSFVLDAPETGAVIALDAHLNGETYVPCCTS